MSFAWPAPSHLVRLLAARTPEHNRPWTSLQRQSYIDLPRSRSRLHWTTRPRLLYAALSLLVESVWTAWHRWTYGSALKGKDGAEDKRIRRQRIEKARPSQDLDLRRLMKKRTVNEQRQNCLRHKDRYAGCSVDCCLSKSDRVWALSENESRRYIRSIRWPKWVQVERNETRRLNLCWQNGSLSLHKHCVALCYKTVAPESPLKQIFISIIFTISDSSIFEIFPLKVSPETQNLWFFEWWDNFLVEFNDFWWIFWKMCLILFEKFVKNFWLFYF